MGSYSGISPLLEEVMSVVLLSWVDEQMVKLYRSSISPIDGIIELNDYLINL